jgi:prepilin-type N-terminal cleavage/methylation domain-containing protein
MKTFRSSLDTEGGFTLLELLIATALLAIILTALYSTFFLSRKAIDGLDESLIKLQECRNVLDVIGREAESLLYLRTNSHSFFKLEDRDIYGEQTSRLSFTGFSPLTYGLSAISYYVEEKDGVLTLYKKMENPYHPDDAVKGVDLIDGIGSFGVEIKQADKWVRTWDTVETGTLPTEIRITITATIKGRPVSLFETVRPMIGGVL